MIKPTGSGTTNAPTGHFSCIHTKSYSEIHLISFSIMSLAFIFFFCFSPGLNLTATSYWCLVRSTPPILQQWPNSALSRLSCLLPLRFFFSPRRKPLHLLGAFTLILQSRTIFLNLWQLTPPQSHKANECGFYFCKLCPRPPCNSHLKKYKVWHRSPLEERIRSLLKLSLPHLGDDKLTRSTRQSVGRETNWIELLCSSVSAKTWCLFKSLILN